MEILFHSGIEAPYSVSVWLDENEVGQLAFAEAGHQLMTIALPPRKDTGFVTMAIRVPFLCNPQSQDPGSRDYRKLGVAVRSISIS